ncbi:MAG: zinc-ribbon domain-containing protein [Flavobacteriales bacterium]
MIIQGIKKKETRNERIFDTCPDCGTKNCIDVTIYQRYYHFFFIPVFPVWKSGEIVCSVCGAQYKSKKLSGDLKLSYENVKRQSILPKYMFSGVIVFFCSDGTGDMARQQACKRARTFTVVSQIERFVFCKI